MKPTTPLYREVMARGLRNQSHAEVTFHNIDAETQSAAFLSNVSPQSVHADSSALLLEYPYGATIATLELNRWALDGAQAISGSDNAQGKQGYISSALSDNTGLFSQTQELMVQFPAPSKNLRGVTIVFDSRCDEHPVSVAIRLDQVHGEVGDGFVGGEHAPIEGNAVFIPISYRFPPNIDYQGWMYLTISIRLSIPYRRMYIEHLSFGDIRTFGNDELVEVVQSNDVDPISRRLPQKNVSFTILDPEGIYNPENPQGVYESIDLNSPISVRHGIELDDGTVSWLPSDRYILDAQPETANRRATFKGAGMLRGLTGRFYKGQVGTRSLYDLALDVLQDAGIPPSVTGNDPWELSEDLKLYTTVIPLPIDTHSNLLQMIAHAGLCVLYTDDNNVIHIEHRPIFLPVQQTLPILDFNTIADGSLSTERIPALKAIEISVTRLISTTEVTVLFDGDVTSDSNGFVHIELSQAAENISVNTSPAVVMVSTYARVIEFQCSAAEEKIHVTATGNVLTESTQIVEHPIDNSGEVDHIENPLIGNETHADDLAKRVVDYLKMRTTYDFNYRGNAEIEAGDHLVIESDFSPKVYGIVLKTDITFNGVVSGTIKAKKWEDL